MTYRILYLCLLLTLTACGRKQSQSATESEGISITLSHAKGFDIRHTDKGYTTVTVYNPWKQGEVYDRYYLVKDSITNVPSDGHKVTIPLKSLMTNSATHLGFLDLLDEINKVTGVCSAAYIYHPTIRSGVKTGIIKDLGDSFCLDIENLLMLHPQVVMTTAYNAEDENSKRMRQTGLTLLYNIEWQEPSILGRAEWIKFIAAFFDKETLADSIYTDVEQKYERLKMRAKRSPLHHSIFSGQDYRGTWSMPGGNSYSAQLFRDACTNYYYSKDSTYASISTNIEEVLMHFSKDDLWVGVQANSLEELGKMDRKYKLFKAYQDGNVYNTNKRTTPSGGNDYWESGVARPDLLLADMMKVCHPNIMMDYEFTYFQQLK